MQVDRGGPDLVVRERVDLETAGGELPPINEATLDGAVEGTDLIQADYPSQARAARRLAEAEFDSRLVLGRLLEELGP